RPVGRPDAGVVDLVAGPGRQLRRRAGGRLAGALARPEGSREDRLMIALHAGPAPAPRRQLFVGTALAGAAIITLFGGMLATWMRMRTNALDATGEWLPRKI